MTNKELIKRFFRGRYRGDEESYGFSIKPLLKYKSYAGDFSLYSKTSQLPMAARVTKSRFIISPPHIVGACNANRIKHKELVVAIADQMKIKYILSPSADRANFQSYMEIKINDDLASLAQKLEANLSERFMPLVCTSNVDFVHKYQKLLKDVHTLLDGELNLELPRRQMALLDTKEIQSLWKWLIKDNPNEEDREFLRKTYILNHFLPPCQEKKKGSLIMISNPR
jgi:hypothetical protein